MKRIGELLFCLLALGVPVCAAAKDEPNDVVWGYYSATVRVKIEGKRRSCNRGGCQAIPAVSGGAATVVASFRTEQNQFVAVAIGCEHYLRNWIGTSSISAETFWPEYKQYSATVVKVDVQNDLSVLAFTTEKEIACVPIAEQSFALRVGDRVCTIGCPQLQSPQGFFTNISSVTATSNIGEYEGSPRYETDTSMIGGHSGGGLFKDGKLIGVGVSRSASTGQFVPLPLLRKIYAEVQAEKLCFRCPFFHRQSPSPVPPPYQGPPSSPPPSLRPEPSPEPPPPAIPPQPASDPTVPLSVLSGAVSGLGAIGVEFGKRMKAA